MHTATRCAGLGLALVLVALGCTVPVAGSVRSATSAPALVHVYYPELRTVPYTAIRVSSRLVVLNVDPAAIDPTVLRATAAAWEQLDQRVVSYTINGTRLPLQLRVRTATTRVLFLVPRDTAPSTFNRSLGSGWEQRHGAFTHVVEDRAAHRTIVALYIRHESEEPLGVAAVSVYTELCQSLIHVHAPAGQLPAFPTTYAAAPERGLQEVVCNGVGVARYARELGHTYGEYQAWSRGVSAMSAERGEQVPWFTVPSDLYAALNSGQMVLNTR
jgi:hypothetical protein